MHFQLILPAEPLRSLIRFYWIMAEDMPAAEEKTFRILANGSPGLVFQRDPLAFLDREQQRLPQMFLHGQNTQYYGELKVRGAFYNIGVDLEPGALPALFGLAASELTDEMADIRQLVPQAIVTQLAAAPAALQQIALLDAFFLEQLKRYPAAVKGLQQATEWIRKGYALSEVQRQLNVSERTLERQFKQHIGLSPKLYARICRFQSALQVIREADFTSLTELAYRYNYFDQAHFIREFQAFAGAAPTSFITKAREALPGFPEWES